MRGAVPAAAKNPPGGEGVPAVLRDGSSPRVMHVKLNQKKAREPVNRSRISVSIFDHLRQPALVLDCEGRVVVWNDSMERYTGIRAEDIVGKGGYAHGEALFGERLPTLADHVLSHSDAGGDPRYRLPAREGGEVIAGTRPSPVSGREVASMAAPLYDTGGGLVGAVETIQDTPDARPLRDFPGVPEEQAQVLADALSCTIFTLNRDGTYSRFFMAGAREPGAVPEDLVGRTPHALFPAAEADFLVEAAHRVIEAGEVVAETRSFVWHGEQRSFEVTMHPLHDPKGRIVAAAGVSREITRDLLRERALQEANQASILYLDLLGTDIYNTSMVAATVIEMLRERLSGEEGELAQRAKNTVEQGINVIKNVELLNTLNKHRIRLEPVDLDAIIRGQIRRYAGIDIRYEGGSCMVWANPLLEHIVSNLISNSIKFGGMKVRIEISVMETAEVVTLSIADTGIGIPDHLKPNIFDRFSRESRTVSGGRGLGLHIVKTLTNQYGGRVWAADRVPGKPEAGAAIKVILQKC